MSAAAGGKVLTLSRTFAAGPERLWRAWARPEEMVRWLGPPDWPASEMSADVRVGGAWRACLVARDGSGVLWQSGRYLVVDAPRLLRFSFRWESAGHADAGTETVVTVRLERLADGGTRLTLTQEGLTSAGSVDGHAAGWGGTLERLRAQLDNEGGHPWT